MTDNSEIETELTAREHGFAEQLQADRPVPGAAFRGALGRHLAARDPGYGPRPARLRPIAFGHLVASAVLLALGGLQAMGIL
jgi:hypothetical protein